MEATAMQDWAEEIEAGPENRAEIRAHLVAILGALVVLAVALVALGCSDKSRRAPAPAPVASQPPAAPAPSPALPSDGRPDGRYVTSPRGVRVWAPDWLRGSLLSEALAEIDATESEADSRVSVPLVGVPLGVEAVIRDPGSYSLAASPTGLARGHTDMTTVVHVAWRMAPWETRPLMPALAHELRHCATGDRAAGH